MVWDRYYRSNRVVKNEGRWVFATPADGPLGYGWTNLWLCRIEGDAFVNEEGRYFYFSKDANGAYIPNMKAGMTLRKTVSGLELTEAGGRTFSFAVTGKLMSIKDQAGNAANLIYSADGKLQAIKDVMGKQSFTFTYNAGGRIDSVSDLAGRATSYEYDSFGNLTKVSQQGRTIALYSYNSFHGVTSKSNALTETYTIDYYPSWAENGVVWKVTDPTGTELIKQGQPATGHFTAFTYDFSNRTFYYTDQNGATYMNVLNTAGDVVAVYEVKDGAQVLLKKVEYLDNRVTRTTDALGNITKEQKDEWGNVILKVDGGNYEWRYTYIPERRLLLTATDPLGSVTKYEYDAAGNRTKETVAAGTSDESVTTYTYNQYREMLTETRYTATTTYDYDDAGNLRKITDPLQHETPLTYDAAGNLLTRTEPLVGATTYENYDYQGNPGKVTDLSGNSITYTYDDLGRVKTATNQADSGVTQYFYVTSTGGGCTSCGGGNGAGKLSAIILPEGNRIDYSYDGAGNLTKITDNDKNSINYTYDNKGNRTKEEIKDSATVLQKTLSYEYDLLNRLKKTINPDTSYTEYGYNSRGNRTALKDPNNNSTIYTYDVANRLWKLIQPGNITTTYSYDRRNNLTSVTAANGNTTSYVYDKRNRLTKTTSPDTGITTYTYDDNNNLKTNTDAKNVTATYEYDAANRLTSVTFPLPGDDSTYTYNTCLNGKGRLCKMTDSSGTTTYEYTKKGQLAKETKIIDGQTFITEYGYDKNGNNTTMKYPSGRVVAYTYDNDKVTGILNNGITIASNISYTPFGGLTSLTYGNGIHYKTSYDNRYRMANISAANVQNLNYRYDNNGNITSITDNLDSTKSKSYGYDSLDRLINATGPWGSLSYTYDGVGNRQTESNGGSSTYGYQPNSNRLLTVSGAKNYTFGYDANGNTTADNSRTFIYNQNQRMIKVTEQIGEQIVNKGEYVYGGNGQIVKKVTLGTTELFFYDQQELGIAQVGSISADYIFLNGNPFAKAEGSSINYYHNDYLGTPHLMTDGQKQIVWEIQITPFGETTNINGAVTNNIRFPGQYYEQESGLNYNYFRNYNPIIGRYIEADPVGLDGGLNLYLYVENNPVNKLDPEGLLEILPWININAGEGYGADAAMYWAQRSIDPNNAWYETGFAYTMGLFASLWTPCTSTKTFAVLTVAYGAAKWVGRPFWQYYPGNNPAYSSPWMTRGWGWKPPFKAGKEARNALNLPPWNTATRARTISPKWYEPVVGPRTPKPQPDWGWSSKGAPFSEYFRGWRFPD